MNREIIRAVLVLGVIILLVKIVLSYDLSEYPNFFKEDNCLDLDIVMGESSQDIEALKLVSNTFNRVVIPEYGTCGKKIISVKYDKEEEEIETRNIISIGGPCANKITAEIMGLSTIWPECANGFKNDRARIILYNKFNKTQLIVAGYNADDTRNVAEVLANYQDYNLTGMEIEVTGSSGNLTATPLVPRIEQTVIEALKTQNETKVTIMLRKRVIFDYSGKSKEERESLSKEEQKIISNVQNEVLSTLDESDFKLKHMYPGTYALTGWITKKGIEKLKNNPYVEYIYIPAIGTET